MSNLTYYLRQYYNYQEKIMLVHRPTKKDNWRCRHLYLSEEYNPTTPYNHRSILKDEVVIEFDEDDRKLNKKYADKVAKKLKEDGFSYSKWFSGNKSVHVHIIVDTKNATNIQLLKKTIMRYYSEGIALPDLRLASNNHLIRAEYGVHEKTQEKKSLISKSNDYPTTSVIPQPVWKRYLTSVKQSISNQIGYHTRDLVNHKGFQWIVNSSTFREAEDGRERALFMLIHVLKEKYKDDKEGLIKFLQEWYSYSSGTQLDKYAIERKINYHWKRNYNIGKNFINELLESLGRSDLCE